MPISKIIQNPRAVYLLVLLFVIIFIVLNVINFTYMREIYQDNLHKLMNEKMNEAQSRVLMPLKGLEVTLKFISDNIQDMVLRGESIDVILNYLDKCSDPINRPDLSVIDYSSVFGYFPQIGVFHDGGGFAAPEGYDPSKRPWFIMGAEGGGNIMFVLYIDAAEGGLHTFAYARGIYDSANNLIAVIAMEVATHVITDYLLDKNLPEGGYGFILDENLRILAHPNPDFMFKLLSETNSEFGDLANELKSGVDISARRLLNYRNEKSIVFCQMLENGWYVGIMASINEFYADMNTITMISIFISIVMGIILCAIMVIIIITWKKARQASLQKSTFLANMSHEIRTPMNSIIGFSELAIDDNIPPVTKNYLNKIHENAIGLLLIINDILDISKVESGKMEMDNIPFDMQDLLASCRSLIMPKVIEKNLVLYFYAEPSINVRPLGDPVRLRQVLVNLLSNAVKFTNIGTVKLIIQILDKTEKNITMGFEIKDSGIGMTNEQISRIFDPFTQAEASTTRKFGGTGLGLSITKKILEAMGGKITVESTPGVGSKFSFKLTFNTIDVKDSGIIEKVIFDELEKPVFKGEVLLCEDNVMNQQVICEHLTRVGLKTVVAKNGKIGVDLIRSRIENGKKQFDLVFMDIHMPVMDGLEAASKILEFNVNIPIVALTANIMSDDREIYKTSGMHDYVGKPFTSQELWRCLMRFFTPLNWKTEHKHNLAQANSELTQKLIDIFVKNNQDKYAQIKNAIDKDDIKLAHRLTHTLKSNAGQLGRTLLQQIANEIENSLKDGMNLVTPQQLASLEKELNAAIIEFMPLVQESQYAAAEPIDEATALELLEELEHLLKENNFECLSLTAGLQRIPGSEKLIRQVEDFNFTLAIDALTELKRSIKKELS